MNGFDLIEEAIEDLKKGRPIIVCDDEDRENEGDLVMLAEHATPENINFMITYGKGLVCVPVSPRIAQRLDLAPMTANNTDPHGTAFTLSIDHEEAKTGISAEERIANDPTDVDGWTGALQTTRSHLPVDRKRRWRSGTSRTYGSRR